MSVYAQLEDMAAWSGIPIVPDQASEVQFLLNEAEVELQVVSGDLGDRITAGRTTAARVKTALCGMVGRVLRDRANEMVLLAAADPTGARSVMSSWLSVGRRERSLVGMSVRGDSMDLTTRDPQLVRPLVRAPWDRWSGYCR